MQTEDTASQHTTWRTWVGRLASGLVVLFLLFDAGGKLFEIQPVLEASKQIGYPAALTQPLGVVVLVCAAIYAIPRTAVLGAILLTGFLGGAIASHLRIGSPLLTHVLFGLYLGALAWGGLWLRDERVRMLFQLHRRVR